MNMNSIKLFTIGYTKRSAEIFFSTLKQAEIKLLIDVRLNNTSQLAGYTKKDDLSSSYKHMPELAPTADILDGYKAKAIDWQTYELKFRQLLEDRNLIPLGETMNLDHACLLCAEPRPDKCHRRLVAEYLQKYNTEIEIKHL
jgi:uncharacterized protein (DUF488 family)